MLSLFILVLYSLGVAPSQMSFLTAVLFQLQGVLFWGAYSGLTEYVDVSVGAGTVQWVLGWIHNVLNWRIPPTANAIMFGAPWLVRIFAYLTSHISQTWRSRLRAWLLIALLYLGGLLLCLVTALVPFLTFAAPIYTYALVERFTFVAFLFTLFWWCLCGVLVLFMGYLSLFLAIFRVMADAVDAPEARTALVRLSLLASIFMDPVGFISMSRLSPAIARRIAYLAQVWGGLAFAPYVYFARYFGRVLFSPIIVISMMTKFINEWDPEDDPVVTVADADALPFLVRQMTLICLIVYAKARSMRIDIELILNSDNFFYPLKLLFFAAHHYGSISWRRAEDYPSAVRRPATLGVRLWFMLFSPIYPFFFNFGLIPIVIMGFTSTMALTAGLPLSPLYWGASLWPLLSFLWCQVESVRDFLLELAATKGREGSLHEPTWFAWVRRRLTAFYFDAYLWACDATSPFNLVAHDHVVFYYHEAGERVNITFRQSPEMTDELLDKAGFLLHRFTNPNWQHYMAGLFVPLLMLFFILTFLKRTVYHNIKASVKYCLDVLCWFTFWLFVPDTFFVVLLAYSRKAQLHVKAYAETAWPYEVDEDDDVFTQMGKAAGYIWGLAALFRLSFLTKEQLDEFGVAAWPAMDPAARARRLAWVRSASIRILKTFDDLRLPEFIEAQWASPTADDIKASYQSLKDMGWPIEQEFIDSIHNPSDDAYFNTWASLRTHLVAVSNYRLGIIRGKAGVPDELSHLQGLVWAFGQVTGYVHTVTYNSIEAEERSTARYFTGEGSATQNLDPDEVSDILDGLWQGVKSQFSFSKLASFDYVFNHWEKKFNMGFGFSAPGKSGVKKQLTRNQAIQITGGRRAFMALWADTFKKAASLVPVAPVFAKLETLKEKKYLQRAVRTVVGSAITHHIMTTVFNYLPNHNYKIWDTPMKVGMSFNGQNFGRLWQSLSKHTFVWAGDMTAFDSTVSPAVLKIVAECRKKGYTSHADFHRICLLIDIAYEQLLNHPMGFKATGKIVTKEQGFTTGHSSTSPDNSLALVVTYLFAWRRVTGLRAREFYTYNTLANFGDDHVLGWEPVFGWSPEAAMRAIREIGCYMRDEAPTSITLPGKLTREKALEAHKILNIEEPFEQYWQELQWVNKHPLDIQFSFLAKIPLERTGRVNQELADHGVQLDYEFATCHDPRRLVGKITGQIFLNTHPKIRRDRMLSYMDLCAHHRDIYEQLKNAVHIIDRKYARIWRRDGTWDSLKAVPTYTDVMRRWYDDKSNVKVPVYADDELDESMLDASDDLAHLLSNDGFVDNAVRFLADVPTIIAPRLGLPFWGEWLLSTYAPYFSWVYELVGFANHVSHSSLACMNIVDQTAYRICSHPNVLTHFSNANTTTLYVRHWLFCVFNFFRRTEYRATWFDLPRVLDNYIAQWAFILLGRTTTVVRGVDVDILGLIVIAGLGLFHLPPSLDSFLLVWRDTPVVSASQVFSSLWYEFRRLVAPLGAVDTQSWIALVRNLRIGSEGVVVSAPTGVGKSTRMIADAQAATGKRIVVIQPRSVVVLGVAAFMRSIYPGTSIASLTEEGSGTPRDQIVYCTPQYFFLSDQLRDTTNTIYVLDEAHIDEPLYHAAIEWLRRMAPGYILMTATPRPEWPETRRLTTIPCKSRFSVQRVDHEVASTAEYVTRAVDMAQKAVDLHKILIFVPTLALGHTLLSRLPEACFINSKNKTPDFSKRIFISTNVADAGLTIPDVAIVLSMDVDVFVSTRLETDGMIDAQRHYKKVVTSGYRSLTEQTIRQRQGRTGRTCDGAFHLFRTRVQRDDRPDRFTLQDYVDAAGPALPIIAVLVDGLQEFVTERRAELGVRDSSSPWWERIASNFAKFVDGDDNQTNHFRTVEEYKDLNNNETHLDSIETFYLDDEELPDEDIVAIWPVDDPEPPVVSTYAGVPNQSVFAGVPGVAGAEWGPDPLNPQYPRPFAFPSAFGSPSKEEFEFACSLLGLHPVKTFFFIRDRFSQDPILQDVPFKMWTHIDGYGFAIAEYTKTSSTQYFERLVHSFNQVTAAARGSVIPSDVVPSSIVASGPAASTVEPVAIPTSSGKSRAEMTVDESHKFTLDNLALIWDLDGAPIEPILKRLHITETALLLAWTSAPDHFFFTTTLAELEETYGVQELSANFHRLFFGSSSGQGSLPT